MNDHARDAEVFFMRSFADAFVQMRRSMKLTQLEISKVLGVTQQAIAKWEAAEALPSRRSLIEITRLAGPFWVGRVKIPSPEALEASGNLRLANYIRALSVIEQYHASGRDLSRLGPSTPFQYMIKGGDGPSLEHSAIGPPSLQKAVLSLRHIQGMLLVPGVIAHAKDRSHIMQLLTAAIDEIQQAHAPEEAPAPPQPTHRSRPS